jgi:hypothetical protein
MATECKPILFRGMMVRALLAGTKTQTRRVVKPDYLIGATDAFMATPEGQAKQMRFCHYGQPGDRLWVRESGWERPPRTARMLREGADTWAPFYFDADGYTGEEMGDFKAWGFKRRPSIHMPRRHSRITLDLTHVRVERLLDISEADAQAEGVERVKVGQGWRRYAPGLDELAGLPPCATAACSFRSLWDMLHGPGSAASNPWVWVLGFRRLEAG